MVNEINDLKNDVQVRERLLHLNNVNARETSLLTSDRFDRMIAAARVATFIGPSAAFLLAFEDGDDYDGRHFLWFRSRVEKFLYIDRVVVAHDCRRHGHGRSLYVDLFRRAEELGIANVSCEVNLEPPNPASDRFHAALGFKEVGRATLEDGMKTVRYLCRRQ